MGTMVAPVLLLALLAGTASSGAVAGNAGCARVETKPSGRGRTEYTLYSHEEYEQGSKHAHNLSCSWTIPTPPPDSTWLVTFISVDLESSVSSTQCKYDNLTVSYVINGQGLTSVLCGKHSNLILLTNSSFQLRFRSDATISQQGFKITWRSSRRAAARLRTSPIFLSQGSAGSCKSLESSGGQRSFGGIRYNVTRVSMAEGTYLHNADCTWIIQTEVNTAVYMTFESLRLEGTTPCTADNVTVIYRLSGRSQSQRRVLCNAAPGLTLVSRGMVTLQLRTDHSAGTRLSVSWFVAPFPGRPGMFDTSQEFSTDECPEVERMTSRGRIRLYYEPPLTYEPRMRCTWSVSVPAGKMANFTFTKFQLARGYSRPWHRYNYTRLGEYCSGREDAVRISYREIGSQYRQSKSFCYNSNVRLGESVLGSVGDVIVEFSSNGHRSSHGFILEYRLSDEVPTPRIACPPVRQLDSYRQQIANLSSGESTVIYGSQSCTWILQSPGDNHLMSLIVTMRSQYSYSPYYSGLSSSRYRRPLCEPMVIVTSQAYLSRDALFAAGDQGGTPAAKYFRREFCYTGITDMPVGLFAGTVNVSIVSRQFNLNVRGFGLLITKLPKPQKGCSTVKVSTEYYKSRAVKVFNITGNAGCITSESVTGLSPVMYSKTLLNVTFELTCSNPAGSSDALEVISESFVTAVKCGKSGSVLDSWNNPLILKFPTGTGASLVSKVTYNFPVMEAFCMRLNGKTAGGNDTTFGSYILPLFLYSYSASVSPVSFQSRQMAIISCDYQLNYRPGYSILLKISHNLGYDDLDFYCHAKTQDRRLNPHIVLTVSERDPDYPGTWVESRLDLCHGYSVGSLGAKSELLVDGSVSISLLAVNGMQRAADNTTRFIMAMGLWSLMNKTMAQPLQFLITYQYVPSCPDLNCRAKNGPPSSCSSTARMSDVQLEVSLAAGSAASGCKLNIPTDRAMRSALAAQSPSWLARVEIASFAIGCPCHDCEAEELQEFVTVSHKTQGLDAVSEKIVICGDYVNSSKVVYMTVGPGKPDVQISYGGIESGATVRVTFVDCQKNTGLSQCQMALMQNKVITDRLLDTTTTAAPHGGLIVAAVLLALILIGCLLFLNRETLMSGGSRIQESLRSRRPPGPDDTLQLTHESAAAQ